MDDNFIKDYEGLVRSIAYKYTHLGLSVEDFVQEGMIGLLEAHRRFKDDKGASFATYATIWIKKKILAYIDKELKEKNAEFGRQNAECERLPVSSQVRESSSIRNGADGTPPLKFSDDMPPEEKQILTLYFVEKKSLIEIAKTLNISREKARQIKTKALRRLRAKLNIVVDYYENKARETLQ